MIEYLQNAISGQFQNMELKRTRRHTKQQEDATPTPQPSPKKTRTSPGSASFDGRFNFTCTAGEATLALKTTQTKDKEGMVGIKRFFKAKVDGDDGFSFSFTSPKRANDPETPKSVVKVE